MAPQDKSISHYYLVTPWTPTPESQQWFADEVVSNAEFPCQWDGGAFLDGLSAVYPATFDRFFRGPNVLDNMILAKATLASSPVEAGGPATMLEAVRRRESALRDIRDLASDSYFVNSGTISSADDKFPLPAAGDPSVFYRYEALENNRFHVESIVPRNSQVAETDPISFELEFLVAEDTPAALKIDDWRAWGGSLSRTSQPRLVMWVDHSTRRNPAKV